MKSLRDSHLFLKVQSWENGVPMAEFSRTFSPRRPGDFYPVCMSVPRVTRNANVCAETRLQLPLVKEKYGILVNSEQNKEAKSSRGHLYPPPRRESFHPPLYRVSNYTSLYTKAETVQDSLSLMLSSEL